VHGPTRALCSERRHTREGQAGVSPQWSWSLGRQPCSRPAWEWHLRGQSKLKKVRQKRLPKKGRQKKPRNSTATCPGDLSAGSWPGRRLSPVGLVSGAPATPGAQKNDTLGTPVISLPGHSQAGVSLQWSSSLGRQPRPECERMTLPGPEQAERSAPGETPQGRTTKGASQQHSHLPR